MSDDVRALLHRATQLPALADPLPQLRTRAADRRRRQRRALAAGAAGLVVVASAAVGMVRTLPGDERESLSMAAEPGASSASRSSAPTDTAPTPTARPDMLPSDKAAPTSGPYAPTDPVPDRDGSAAASGVGRFVALHPDVFVGSYLDQGGTAVAVLGPDVDPAVWADYLRRAAGGGTVRTRTCAVSPAALTRAREELSTFPWPSGRPSFAAAIDPQACTVMVLVAELPAVDATALQQHFGELVQVRTGVPVSRR